MCKLGSCSLTEEQNPLHEVADQVLCALYENGISAIPLTDEVARMNWMNDLEI
jgi:hypothetical protein